MVIPRAGEKCYRVKVGCRDRGSRGRSDLTTATDRKRGRDGADGPGKLDTEKAVKWGNFDGGPTEPGAVHSGRASLRVVHVHSNHGRLVGRSMRVM